MRNQRIKTTSKKISALLVISVLSVSVLIGFAIGQPAMKVTDTLPDSVTVTKQEPKKEFNGRELKLPRKKVARGLGSLLLEIDLPRGYHFTERAPSRLNWQSNSGKVITFADSSSGGSQKKAEFPFRLPFEAYKGKTELILEVSLFFCANDSGICLFDDVRIIQPIKITKDGSHKLSLEISAEAPESFR